MKERNFESIIVKINTNFWTVERNHVVQNAVKKENNMDRTNLFQSDSGIDGLIAEKIFGEPKPEYGEPNDNIMNPEVSPKGAWQRSYVYDEGDTGEWKPRPYSSHIGFAYKVLKNIGDRDIIDIHFSLKRVNVMVYLGESGTEMFTSDNPDDLPLLICKAALRLKDNS